MKDINEILALVLSRIRPNEAEKAKLQSLSESLIVRINSIGENERLDIKGLLVGSSARGTWISGDHDLDIFIMFPPGVERNEFEEKGLYIARKVAEKAESFQERYAEHPCIRAIFNGIEVDLVPAYNVESAPEIKSAVDRTPFHSFYVISRIKELEDDVLLLKQFMKACGVYGSELKTHGFSGYLVELLIIYYGSFIKVLENANNWKNGMIIDIEKHGSEAHNDPMVVVDPTDPKRNVAAALSLDNMCIFIDKACEFLEYPSEIYFVDKIPEPLDDEGFKNLLMTRGTSVIAIVFEAPDVVEDVLFPQFHKLEESLHELLERYDFRVYNTGVWAGDSAIALFELESSKLPWVRKHAGPPVWSGKYAVVFKSKYSSNALSNIHIKNGKYMVDIPRKYNEAKKLVELELLNCALGKHSALSIRKGYRVLENFEILEIRDEGFRRFLRKFFEK